MAPDTDYSKVMDNETATDAQDDGWQIVCLCLQDLIQANQAVHVSEDIRLFLAFMQEYLHLPMQFFDGSCPDHISSIINYILVLS